MMGDIYALLGYDKHGFRKLELRDLDGFEVNFDGSLWWEGKKIAFVPPEEGEA